MGQQDGFCPAGWWVLVVWPHFDRNSIPLQILKQITSITIIIPIWSRVVHWSQPGHNGPKTGAQPGFRAKLDPSDLGPNTTHFGPNPTHRVTKKSSDPIQPNPLICFEKLLLLLFLLLLWELFQKNEGHPVCWNNMKTALLWPCIVRGVWLNRNQFISSSNLRNYAFNNHWYFSVSISVGRESKRKIHTWFPHKAGEGGVVLALCSTKCTWSRLICTLLQMQVSSSIYIVINIEIMHLITTHIFMYQHWPRVGLTRWLDREGWGWVQLPFCEIGQVSRIVCWVALGHWLSLYLIGLGRVQSGLCWVQGLDGWVWP